MYRQGMRIVGLTLALGCLLVCAVLLGCGRSRLVPDDYSDGGTDGFVPEDAPSFDVPVLDVGEPTDAAVDDCGEEVQVDSVEALLALVPSDWGEEWPASRRTRTVNIEATANLLVPQTIFTIPENCERPCFQDFSVQGVIPGLRVAADGWLFATGSRFRMRFTVLRPGAFPPVALVEIIPACAEEASCADGTLFCATDSVCYGEPSYCLDCEAEAVEVCACRDNRNQPMPEGSMCSFVLRGDDIGMSGICVDSICTP